VSFLAPARLPALILAAGIAAGYVLNVAWPVRYSASARVMMPDEQIVSIANAADDPQSAARPVTEQVAVYLRLKGQLIDPPMVRAQRPSFALNLALGGAAGLGLALALFFFQYRRRRPVRTERDLLAALGPPLLAARPARTETMRPLCIQLLEHWFSAERALLAIVGANPGEGRSGFAAQLAVAFAELGHKTLLIDGDFRAPGVHRAFRLPNTHGLADFLQYKQVSLASAGTDLAVMVAGSAMPDPLELLSRPRLAAFLAEARKHFRVVLIDTPAAARGPDFEIFAALAGGALVLTRRARADATSLRQLRGALMRCTAQLVTTVVRED
jgi:Mrp family chromosome partitioning ATPase